MVRELLQGQACEKRRLRQGAASETDFSRNWLRSPVGDEGNHVPVRISDMKIRPAPRLFCRRLAELHATLPEFLDNP
jgi:hypothetical protein